MVSRRQFLAGASAALSSAAIHSESLANTAPGVLRTAVIGAGMSGLYSAWRLVNAGHPYADIANFEGSARIGGRLRSEAMPGTENTVAEFGGMRYLTSQMADQRADPPSGAGQS